MMATQRYWTAPQVLHWLRDSNRAAVEAMDEPGSGEALRLEILKSRWGRHNAVEIILTFPRAIARGLLTCVAVDVGMGKYTKIQPEIGDDLAFQIHPDDPFRPFGFWSKATGKCLFVKPLFLRKEIIRAAPPPHKRAEEDRLLALLTQIIAEMPLTKDEARERCAKHPDYWARGFERAWARLPADRKRGRGKHGTRRI